MAYAAIQPRVTAVRLMKWMLFLGLSLVVSACGNGATPNTSTNAAACDNTKDPAAPVNLNLKTFEVAVADFPHTDYLDYFRAIQPNSSASGNPGDAQAMADSIGTLMQPFIAYSGTPYSSYTKVRNPLDLIDDLISTNAIDNFNIGRQYIATCIAAGNAVKYNNNSVAFSDISAGTTDPSKDFYNNWSYQLSWTTEPDYGKVTRVILARQLVIDNTSKLPQDISLQSIYDQNTFSASGYNAPQSNIFGYTLYNGDSGNSKTVMNFRQTFVKTNTDELDLATQASDTSASNAATSPPTFQFDGKAIRCLKATLDYSAMTMTILTSTNAPTSTDQSCFATTPGGSVQKTSYATDPTAAASRQ
ncbi:hypothetical protein [Mangrovitalea sediminis]|uniref:hypothetical protein n=1 Tax=Mangrovitalea sediminis TaxID=1982043 RepID=UPI00117855FD|nr:hypothetical protein [Mangrovitalea sediminis]